MLDIGDKVYMTENAARFYLEHPESFEGPSSRLDADFETTMMHSMATLLGEQIVGTVVGFGNERSYRVVF